MTDTATATMIEESRTVERAGATAVRAMIQLGAGELLIGPGAADLLEADFSYNVPTWRPELTYTVRDGAGDLTIRQPRGDEGRVRNARQRWALRFAAGVPLALQIQVGAATGALIVGDLALTTLTIETGAGNLTLDLSDARGPLAVTLKGGVINAAIGLPRTIPAGVTVGAPLATIDAPALRRNGRAYRNEADGTPGSGVQVAISGGVASIGLTLGRPATR
jgi:hypothetical protein